jgi:DNA-binding NarL/FixJ family response regulator
MVEMVRVLLADDQIHVRSALRLLLENEPQVEVVGEAAESASLLAQINTLSPDLVLLDWELPGQQGADLLNTLRLQHPNVLVVALSGRPEACCRAVEAGVDAFISKGDPPSRVLSVLRGLDIRNKE